MKGIIAVIITAVVSLSSITSLNFGIAEAATAEVCQKGALIGYGGAIFGLTNVCTDGYTIHVDLVTDFKPKSGWVFGAWLLDDSGNGSGYALYMGKILNDNTLQFDEVMTNARTYTDIVITQQPQGSLSPLPSWSNSVASYWLASPFGL